MPNLFPNLFQFSSEKSVRTVILLAIAVSCFFSWKLALMSEDSIGRARLHRSEGIFDDDGGVYVSLITVAGEGSRIREQQWYKDISRVSEISWARAWGPGSVRIFPVFTGSPCPLYTGYVASLKSLVGTYKAAFRLSIILFPLFMAATLAGMFLYFRNIGRVNVAGFAALFLFLFESFSHNHWWKTSSAYGWVFFVPGSMIWIFGRANLGDRLLSLAILMIASLFHSVVFLCSMLAIALSLAEYFFPELWQKTAKTLLRNFTVVLAVIALSCIWAEFSWRPIFFLNPELIGMWWKMVRFVLPGHYLHPIFIFLALLAGYFGRVIPDPSRDLMRAAFAAFGVAMGVLCIAVLGPLLPLNASYNSGRLYEFTYLFLATTVFAIFSHKLAGEREDFRFAQKLASGVILCSALALSFPQGAKLFAQDGLAASILPPKVQPNKGGPEFYFARNASEIYSYFLHDLYTEAPLVVRIQTPEYDPGRAYQSLLRAGPYRW